MFSRQQQLLAISTSICLLLSPPTFAQDLPKEGPVDFEVTAIGEATILAAGQGTLQLNYAVNGLRSKHGEGVNGIASMHCVGAASVFEGKWDNESGLCSTTYPDGSTTMTRYGGSGTLGGLAEGSWSFMGGTGALSGITGGGSYTRISGPNPSETRSSSRSTVTGTYKLP
ncbi:hypothetical protein [Parasedimentitalea huanghaiensis]|uniref:Uncharacterized protein n=1 Tax=Parasedimentitalea huanghaiensis TaxID=2682100 RepID=A0A6L6WGY5_9RHOB|nr:hypothetical protein [Zongyanglinia huanghaiensis]MVO16528.1 hypothetical protein [Zongyanglinia huanghaiensis]